MPAELPLLIAAGIVVAALLLAGSLLVATRRRSGGMPRPLDAEGAGADVGVGAGGSALGAQPAELVRLTDLAGVGLLRVDRHQTITAANESAHRYLGRAPGGLAGLSVIAAFLDHRIEGLLRKANSRGSAQMDLQLAGEPPRTLLVRAERGVGGEQARWLIVQDASELRRLQRIRAEFIDNLSHELRTPLTTIRVLSEILSSEAKAARLPPRVRDAISSIDVETGHLAQMVNELLDLARIEQGERPLRREAADLGNVVESVIARLHTFAERQGVKLRAEVPPGRNERTLIGDAERLEQLLLNVVHNAVKFSPGGGEVVVSLTADETSGNLLLAVADQGVGIPSADLERIFERFYKVDRARSRSTGGTGLGLAIARHIAEQHGGRIWAESEMGRGSRLLVALPAGGPQAP